jgi:hypothetical protein
MTAKRLPLVAVLVCILTSISLPVFAQTGPIPDVYVDVRRTEGNEDGSKENPYNSLKEGEAYGQSLPYGARLHVIDKDGKEAVYTVEPVRTGPEGIPLPRLVLYILLAILAIVLILSGWRVRRRAKRIPVR